jgi:FlaA1/EpsC-like NDP-sugar epimerase
MTLSEAVTLILQAGAAATARGIYVLDMGAPVRVADLVWDLIHLHGLDHAEVETRVTGLRPGEKLHEKLYFDAERPEPTSHAGISRAAWNPEHRDAAWSPDWLEMLEPSALARDDLAVRRALDSIRTLELAPPPMLEQASGRS